MLKVGVRFLNNYNKLSTTKYDFIVTNLEVIDYIKNVDKYYTSNKILYYNYFNITNQYGYNYRKQFVVISSIDTITKEEIKNNNYKEIVKIEYIKPSNRQVEKEDYDSYLFKDFVNRDLEKIVEKCNPFYKSNPLNKNKKERNENNMFEKMMKDVKIGKVNNVKMSIYGPAFNSADGTSLAYDKENKEWIDVTGMTMNTFGTAFSIPVAKNQLKVNDYILHNGMWVRVSEIGEKDTIMVEKIFEKEVSFILPTKNMFGFDFYIKLMYFGIEDMMGEANKDNPFGNMLPLMMLENGDIEVEDMMLMMMMKSTMTKNEGAPSMDFNNPMMMYMMMKDGDNSILPLMLMMNQK